MTVSLDQYIQKTATGPEYSKDLSRDEAADAMNAILDGKCSEVQAAVLLISLRMKRETLDENLGLLDAIQGHCSQEKSCCDELLIYADPYDGMKRQLHLSPFLPALLAACGHPGYTHSCESVGPKYGITSRKILAHAGIPVTSSISQAREQLDNPDIGWAYLDQEIFCPAMHDLVALRREMLKRPALATLEKFCLPVAAKKNHLIIGFVHRAYEKLLYEIAAHSYYDSALILRGIEGGLLPKGNNFKHASWHRGGDFEQYEEVPDMPPMDRLKPLPEDLSETAFIEQSVENGMAILKGKESDYTTPFIIAAARILAHVKTDPPAACLKDIQDALGSGKALAHFEGTRA